MVKGSNNIRTRTHTQSLGKDMFHGNQSVDLHCGLDDWFLCGAGLVEIMHQIDLVSITKRFLLSPNECPKLNSCVEIVFLLDKPKSYNPLLVRAST